MSEDFISQSEFARRLNIGEKTIRDGIRLGKIVKGVVVEKGKKKINYPVAYQEAIEIGLGQKSYVHSGGKSSHSGVDISSNTGDGKGTNGSGTNPLDKSSYAEAARVEKIFKARTAKLEYETKARTLVNKADVDSQLFEFGGQIKSEFESMPARIAPKLATFNDASKLSEYLAKEIRNSLNRLCKIIDETELG